MTGVVVLSQPTMSRPDPMAASSSAAKATTHERSSRPLAGLLPARMRKTPPALAIGNDDSGNLDRSAERGAAAPPRSRSGRIAEPAYQQARKELYRFGDADQRSPREGRSSRRGEPVPPSPRQLYDPEFDRSMLQPAAAASHSADLRSEVEASSPGRPRMRSKREPVDIADLGRQRDSKDSLQSEESGKAPSRSSKEGRHRRRRAEVSKRRIADSQDNLAPPDSTPSPARPSSAAGRPVARHLFDPRSDDPVRFAQSKTSLHDPRRFNDVASVASTVSFAPSRLSTKDALLQQPHVESRVDELKSAYRLILDLEKQVHKLHDKADSLSQRPQRGSSADLDEGNVIWHDLVSKHTELAEAHYSFLQLAFDPNNPKAARLHALPHKYQIPSRLWDVAVQKLIVRMRRDYVQTQSGRADSFDRLVDFIQYAYRFYSQLYEDPTCRPFRAFWLEQLGDLARLRSSCSSRSVEAEAEPGQSNLPSDLSTAEARTDKAESRASDAPSIGQAALDTWDVEERDLWRETATSWYSLALAESPASGRVHLDLALLAPEGSVLRVYHFLKSSTVLSAHVTSDDNARQLLSATGGEDELDTAFRELISRLYLHGPHEECAQSSRRFVRAFSATIAPVSAITTRALMAACLVFAASSFKSTPPADKPTPSSKRTPRSEPDAPQAILLSSHNGGPGLSKLVSVTEQQQTSDGDRHADFGVAVLLAILALFASQHQSAAAEDPVLTIVATWLVYPARVAEVNDRLRIPWSLVVTYLETILDESQGRSQTRAEGAISLLPEDWLLRGVDWSSSSDVYPRGFWKWATKGDDLETQTMLDDIAAHDDKAVRTELDALRALKAESDSCDVSDETRRTRRARLAYCLEAAKERVKKSAPRGAKGGQNQEPVREDDLLSEVLKQCSL